MPNTLKYVDLRFGGKGVASFQPLIPGQRVRVVLGTGSNGDMQEETIKNLVFSNGSGYFVYEIEPKGRPHVKRVRKESKKVKERRLQKK